MTPCLEAQKTPSQTAFVPSMGISQDRRTGGFAVLFRCPLTEAEVRMVYLERLTKQDRC